MNRIMKDKVTGLIALLFGLIMIWYIIPNWVVMKTAKLNHTFPDTFPKFASYALIILGAVLLLKAFYEEWHEKKQGTAQEKTEKAVKDHEKKSFKEATTRFLNSEAYCVVVTAISILLFDFLLPRVGYIWTGCICSILLLVAFRSKKWYHYLIVIAFTFFLYFLFSKVLLVKMP